MKILHTIEGFDAHLGGIATCTYDLLQAMQSQKHLIKILTPRFDSSKDFLGNDANWVNSFYADGIGPFNYSMNAIKALNSEEFDLYHVNGLWQHIVHATCSHARKHKKPYIITPHGMLYPETLKRSYWKKWPMLKLWFQEDIKNASCIHATCQEEMNHLRDFGYKGPIAVIGNPVNIPNYTQELFNQRTDFKSHKTMRLGYLGRLHPRKKIEQIIYALELAQMEGLDCSLTVIGNGEESYENFLRDEVARLNLSGKVEFTGFLKGREKYVKLTELTLLLVPSDMENFGMIIPEALIVGTPVMASLGTPWKDLNTYKCGWWTDNSPVSLANVIKEVSLISLEQYIEYGENGRKLVLAKYAPDIIAIKMTRLYDWILGQSNKPEFVVEYE